MRKRGFTLIVTLATVTALLAIVVIAASATDTALHAQRNRTESRQAELAAEAGIHRAIQVLTLKGKNATLQTDDWYTLGTTGADNFLIGNGSFRLQIVDACAKVNLNTASEAHLNKLPLTQEQVDSLLDWRTAGETPRADGGKDDYYHSLTNPYNAHLGLMTSFDELLQVKGFTPSVLYEIQNTGTTLTSATNGSDQPTLYDLCTVDSESPATGSNGQTLTNINSANLQQLIRSGVSQQGAQRLTTAAGRPFANMAAVIRVLQQSGGNATRDCNVILSNYMVGTSATQTGRINLNTAPDTVLNSLPGFTQDITSQITSRQSTGLNSIADLTSIPGIDLATLQQFVDEVTVNSSRFIVRAVGKAGTTTYTIEAIVDTSGTTPRVVRVEHPPFADMTTRWTWSDASNDIDLGGQS